VVALLKDLGVDDRLGTLIEGESLMNDGSAIVMYTIFSKAIMNPNFCCDVGQVFLWTFRLSFGGPLLGLGIGTLMTRSVSCLLSPCMIDFYITTAMCVCVVLSGFFVVYILEFVRNDMISEVTLTVAAAYSCFLIAEGTVCKVSGVLAVVFCGLYLSEKAIFSVKTEKSLHSFWVSPQPCLWTCMASLVSRSVDESSPASTIL
jgi:NhaP-type Na+/H+ or K+/H+ antiporter